MIRTIFRGWLVVMWLFVKCDEVAAQDRPSDLHRSTTAVPNARFEIVQSQLAVRWTFRLDRYTGRIHQLVRDSSDLLSWEEMRVVERPQDAAARPRFQLFLSGLAARNTFLIDAETGRTWQLVTSKRKDDAGREVEVHVWTPLAE